MNIFSKTNIKLIEAENKNYYGHIQYHNENATYNWNGTLTMTLVMSYRLHLSGASASFLWKLGAGFLRLSRKTIYVKLPFERYSCDFRLSLCWSPLPLTSTGWYTESWYNVQKAQLPVWAQRYWLNKLYSKKCSFIIMQTTLQCDVEHA